MPRIFLTLSILFLLFSVHAADKGEQAAVPEKFAPATPPPANLNRLPIPFEPGSRFNHLRLPRYTGETLSSYMTLDFVEILTPDICYGDAILARIFRPEAQTKVNAQKAWLNINTGLLKSRGRVRVVDPRYTIVGKSVLADTNTGEYFINGPGKGVYDRTKAREAKALKVKKTITSE